MTTARLTTRLSNTKDATWMRVATIAAIDRADLPPPTAACMVMSGKGSRRTMTGRKMAMAIAVAATTFISFAAQADGLVLVNQTGWPLYYTVEDSRGQTVPGGTGCMDVIRSVTLVGPAYANRELIYVRGQTRNGGRGSNCHGSTAANTGNGAPIRMLAGGPKTLTFTLSDRQLQVR